jgi:hypothetical protein
MRDDAARALRVDDEMPREAAGLQSVATLAPDDDFETARRFDRGPSPEATMALRHFERLVDASGAGYDAPPPRVAGDDADRRFRRGEVTDGAESRRPRGAETRPSRGTERPAPAVAAAVALEDPVELEAEPVREEAIRAPRSAPGRSYGSHRRSDGLVTPRSGYQPGRRTVEIRGQIEPRRRPSTTTAALVARPDRVALWAFMLAMFLVLMAIATAQG